eukprot:GHVN01068951.1.p1 GENE.GHVN01068951.1~~GHVN01068951.1.p1  ORF type:complete len:464 (+),score=64.32 GHVN01068951.1:42-1394(+)
MAKNPITFYGRVSVSVFLAVCFLGFVLASVKLSKTEQLVLGSPLSRQLGKKLRAKKVGPASLPPFVRYKLSYFNYTTNFPLPEPLYLKFDRPGSPVSIEGVHALPAAPDPPRTEQPVPAPIAGGAPPERPPASGLPQGETPADLLLSTAIAPSNVSALADNGGTEEITAAYTAESQVMPLESRPNDGPPSPLLPDGGGTTADPPLNEEQDGGDQQVDDGVPPQETSDSDKSPTESDAPPSGSAVVPGEEASSGASEMMGRDMMTPPPTGDGGTPDSSPFDGFDTPLEPAVHGEAEFQDVDESQTPELPLRPPPNHGPKPRMIPVVTPLDDYNLHRFEGCPTGYVPDKDKINCIKKTAYPPEKSCPAGHLSVDHETCEILAPALYACPYGFLYSQNSRSICERELLTPLLPECPRNSTDYNRGTRMCEQIDVQPVECECQEVSKIERPIVL